MAMAQRGKYKLFTIRGIPIGVDWTWFLVLFVIIWVLSGFYRDVLGADQESLEPYVLAVASAFLFFGSILLHELGHAMIARRNGIATSHITLWMFGGIAMLDRDSKNAGEEFRVAAAGPLVTLVIAVAGYILGIAIAGDEFRQVFEFREDSSASGALAMLAWIVQILSLIHI